MVVRYVWRGQVVAVLGIAVVRGQVARYHLQLADGRDGWAPARDVHVMSE